MSHETIPTLRGFPSDPTVAARRRREQAARLRLAAGASDGSAPPGLTAADSRIAAGILWLIG